MGFTYLRRWFFCNCSFEGMWWVEGTYHSVRYYLEYLSSEVFVAPRSTPPRGQRGKKGGGWEWGSQVSEVKPVEG